MRYAELPSRAADCWLLDILGARDCFIDASKKPQRGDAMLIGEFRGMAPGAPRAVNATIWRAAHATYLMATPLIYASLSFAGYFILSRWTSR